jgi:hypothetical protein
MIPFISSLPTTTTNNITTTTILPSTTCTSITLYQNSRPPPSPTLITGQSIIFTISLFFLLVSIPIAYKYRKRPRFHKVRPFRLTVLWAISSSCWVIPAHIPSLAPEFPCAIMVLLFCIALNLFSAVVTVRSMILTIETLYAKRIQKEQTVIDDKVSAYSDPDNNNNDTSPNNDHIHYSCSNIIQRSMIIARIGLGLTASEGIILKDLKSAKGSMMLAGFLLNIPAIIAVAVLFIAFPELAVCSCGDAIFMEIPIAIVISISSMGGICMRALIVAWKIAPNDPHGVMKELAFILTVITPLAAATWILVALDPENHSYQREFSWFFFAIVYFPLTWFASIGYQVMYETIYYRLARRTSEINVLPIPPLMETLQRDKTTHEEFSGYVEQCYQAESLRFLEDYGHYLLYYSEKGLSWRQTKAQHLYNIYVRPGALMEVNISYTTRIKTQKALEKALVADGTSKISLDTVFEECKQEVLSLLQNNAWTEFCIQRRKQGRSLMIVSSSEASNSGG